MSPSRGIAEFAAQPSGLGECQAGVELLKGPEAQEFLRSITDPDAALAEVTALLDGDGDVFRTGMLAFLCGVLVENGGSVAIPVDAVLRLMERYLRLAEERAEPPGDDPDPELFPHSPDLVRAHHSLPFVLLAAMTMLSRDEGARQRLRASAGVPSLVADLEETYETLYYVREVLALLDGREILLIEPSEPRGFILGLTGVQDRMYHFYALAQDALLNHAGPAYLDAEPTDPACVRYARNRGLSPDDHQAARDLIDHQRFGFAYPGVQRPDTGSPAPAPALFFPGSASIEDIPVVHGVPTLFLDRRSAHFQWSPTNMYPVLHEALESRVTLRELPRDEVEARLSAFVAPSR